MKPNDTTRLVARGCAVIAIGATVLFPVARSEAATIMLSDIAIATKIVKDAGIKPPQ